MEEAQAEQTGPSIDGKLISELGENAEQLFAKWQAIQEEGKKMQEDLADLNRKLVAKAGAADVLVELLREIAKESTL